MASSKALMMNKCANCLVYNWVQPDPSVLQKCKQCKIVQYCSRDCQAEHWKSCHKNHCKKLVAAKEAWREGDLPVDFLSHHPFPFPVTGTPGDTTEALVCMIRQVIVKMEETGHPALSTNAALLEQIWQRMVVTNLGTISFSRKIYPPAACAAHAALSDPCADLLSQIGMLFFDETEDQLGLWHTLKLILSCLVDHLFLQGISSMKEPHESVPEELWHGVEVEVGLFPDVAEQIIELFSADCQVPPFKRLLEVVCGGRLNNECMFCNTQIVVGAISGPVHGFKCVVPSVWVSPYFPRIFYCSETSCQEQAGSKLMLSYKWRVGVTAALTKLAPNRCDFCFKLSEKVHR